MSKIFEEKYQIEVCHKCHLGDWVVVKTYKKDKLAKKKFMEFLDSPRPDTQYWVRLVCVMNTNEHAYACTNRFSPRRYDRGE